jgi:hypothetical protein
VDTTALAAVFVILAGYTAFSFRRLENLASDSESWIREHYADESGIQVEMLVQVLTAALPEVFDVYFRLEPPPEQAPLTAAQLRTAAGVLTAKADEAGFRGQQLVTEPVVKAVVPYVVGSLTRIGSSIVLLGPVQEALLTMTCYSADLRSLRRRARSLELMQAAAAIVALVLVLAIGALLMGIRFADPPHVAALGAVAVVPLAAIAEVRRFRFRSELAVRPPAAALLLP